MIKINGKTIPSPSSLQIDYADIDGNTTRNAKGEMIRDRIATKVKLNLDWNALTPSQISTILKSVENTFFSVEYHDPKENKLLTKTFYVGDRSAPMYSNVNGKPVWKGCSFNLVQK